MKKLAATFALCALLFVQVALAAPIKTRIIDGTPVPVSNFPYVANMVLGDFVCTGTLVGSKYVLTAAHCFYDEDNRKVTNLNGYGAIINGTFYSAAKVTVNPTYVPRSSACIDGERDAAIMELSSAPAGISPIPLQRTAPAVGTPLLLVGFGTQGTGSGGEDGSFPANNKVNFGTTTIESVDGSYVNWFFDPGAGEANTAGGDSGGPAFADFGGVRYINSITCGGTGNAGFNTTSSNTRADVIADWVDSIVGSTPADQAPAFAGLPGQTIAVGQPFSYPIQVTGSAPIVVTAATELPPGLLFDGATLYGTPTTAGFYTVGFSASNSTGSASGSIDLNIMAFDPNSAFKVGKVVVSFGEDDDLVTINGKLTLWNKFTPKRSVVTVRIAELAESFTLNGKGIARRRGGFDSIQLSGKIARGQFVKPTVKLFVNLGDSDDLYDQLDQLFPVDAFNGDTVQLPIEITVDGVTYSQTITMRYNAARDVWTKA